MNRSHMANMYSADEAFRVLNGNVESSTRCSKHCDVFVSLFASTGYNVGNREE